MHKAVKFVIALATVGIVILGISTAQGQTPTPAATPTSIPQTPAMLACQQLDQAIEDAEISLFILPASGPDKASDGFRAMQNRIKQRLAYVVQITKEPEPLMYRLVAPAYFMSLPGAASDGVGRVDVGLRQLHRVCNIKGYEFKTPSDTMSVETIVDALCGSSGLVADEKRSPFFDGFGCYNHTHGDDYAGKYHTHGPYGNVIGGY